MNKYPIVPLGEVCDFVYGDGLKETDRKGGDIPVYGSNGIVGWHDEALTKGEALIVGRKGSIGEVHFSKVPCWAIDTTYYIEKTKVPCDFTWLYYILKALDLTRLNKSAAIPGLNREDAYEQKIFLPPLTEQKRIASLLARADRLRQLRRTAHNLGDALLQSVFLEMFGDIKTNSKKWDMCIIDDVVEFSQYGTSDKSNSEKRGYPVLGMPNITYEGRLDLEKLSYVDLSEKEFAQLKLERGDVIFNRTNSTELVGKTTYWNYDFDAVIASYLVKLKLKKDMLPEFFVALLNMPHYKNLFQERCKKAVGQSNISPTLLKEFPIFVPPLSLQEEFAGVVARVESLRGRMGESTRQVEGLFDALLAQTMDNGR